MSFARAARGVGERPSSRARARSRGTQKSRAAVAARVQARQAGKKKGRPSRTATEPAAPEARPISSSFLAALGLESLGRAGSPPPPPPPGISPYIAHGFQASLEKATKRTQDGKKIPALSSSTQDTPLLRECSQKSEFSVCDCYGALDIDKYRVIDYASGVSLYPNTLRLEGKACQILASLTGGGEGVGRVGSSSSDPTIISTSSNNHSQSLVLLGVLPPCLVSRQQPVQPAT